MKNTDTTEILHSGLGTPIKGKQTHRSFLVRKKETQVCWCKGLTTFQAKSSWALTELRRVDRAVAHFGGAPGGSISFSF